MLEAACADGGAWHLLVSSSCLDHMALRVTPFLSPPAPGRTPCCLCSVLGPLRRPVLADVPCAGTTRPGVGRDPTPALLWEVQGAGTAPPRNTGGRGHAHGGRARSPWPPPAHCLSRGVTVRVLSSGSRLAPVLSAWGAVTPSHEHRRSLFSFPCLANPRIRCSGRCSAAPLSVLDQQIGTFTVVFLKIPISVTF